MENDNGILASIPGAYISDALQTLPPAETGPETMETEIDVPGFGRVRFEAKRMKHTRHKSTHYYWSATKATVV